MLFGRQYFEESLPFEGLIQGRARQKQKATSETHSREQGSEAAFTLMRPLKERERVRRGAGDLGASEPGVRAVGCLLN